MNHRQLRSGFASIVSLVPAENAKPAAVHKLVVNLPGFMDFSVIFPYPELPNMAPLRSAALTMIFTCLLAPVARGELTSGTLGKTGRDLYVAKGGDDDSQGAREAPFATLEGARDAIRQFKRSSSFPKGGITVRIQGSDYGLSSTFELAAGDSGETDAPVIYRSEAGQSVKLRANTRIDSKLWKPISAEAAKRVHPKVDPAMLLEFDVTKTNLQRVKQFAPGSRLTDQWYIIDLFAKGRRQPIAQWPNPTENIRSKNDEGWTTMNGSKDEASFYFASGGKPDDGDATNDVDLDRSHRSQRWQASLASAHEVWLKGLWRTSWQPHTIKVSEINHEQAWIRLAEQPPQGMGSKYTNQMGLSNGVIAHGLTYYQMGSLLTD